MADNSKAVKAAKRGKPFKKGDDSRRHMNGSKSRAAVEFNKNLRELLVEEGEKEQTGHLGENTLKLKKVEWLVKSVWKKAIDGESWAVNFIADRVEGKITQPIDMSGQIEAVILSDKFLPDVNKRDVHGIKPE